MTLDDLISGMFAAGSPNYNPQAIKGLAQLFSTMGGQAPGQSGQAPMQGQMGDIAQSLMAAGTPQPMGAPPAGMPQMQMPPRPPGMGMPQSPQGAPQGNPLAMAQGPMPGMAGVNPNMGLAGGMVNPGLAGLIRGMSGGGQQLPPQLLAMLMGGR